MTSSIFADMIQDRSLMSAFLQPLQLKTVEQWANITIPYAWKKGFYILLLRPGGTGVIILMFPVNVPFHIHKK